MIPKPTMRRQTALRTSCRHEFGAVWGYSPTGGPLWSDHKDIRYMPILIRYSYSIKQQMHWAFRYAPEITALSIRDDPNWWKMKLLNLHRRTYLH